MVSSLKISVVTLGLWSIRGERPKTKGANRDFKELNSVIQISSSFKQPNSKIG